MAHFSVYGVNPIRLLAAFAIGLWLADGWGLTERRNRWLLVWGAVSLAYMIAIQLVPRPGIFPYTWQPQNVVGFGYTALLVMAGMRWLPETERGAWTVFAELGRASYHVFLTQMLWFGFQGTPVRRGAGARGPDLAVTARLGVLPGGRVVRVVGARRQVEGRAAMRPA